MAEASSDLATLRQLPLTNADAWFMEDADEVEGFDLVKEDALFSLVGVPFRITRLVYRPGIQQKGIAWRNDYVSAELRVFPDAVLLRDLDRILSRRTGDLIRDPKAIPTGGEQLVINDGSTGFYRQSVIYLEGKELITVPSALPAEGGKNECRYDLPASEWEISEDDPRVGIIPGPDDSTIFAFAVKLNCSRGLRYSDYDNPTGSADKAVTFYIA